MCPASTGDLAWYVTLSRKQGWVPLTTSVLTRGCAYIRKHISMQQVYDFYSIGPPDEALGYLSSILEEQKDDPQRSAILMDFYFYTLRFAKSNSLSPEQASVFFSIMKTTHERAAASPFIHLEKDYKVFKDMLLRHAIHRPPFSQKIFSLAEVKAIDEYAVNTYFRHYLMYKYAFTKKLRLNLNLDNDAVDSTVLTTGESAGKEAASNAPSEEGDREITIDEPSLLSGFAEPDVNDGSTEAKDSMPLTNVTAQQQQQQQQPPAAAEEAAPAAPVPQPPTIEVPEIVQKETQQTQPDEIPEPAAPEAPRPTVQEIASKELAAFVTATLAVKMEELRKSLMTKLQVQEDQINSKLKKLDDGDDKGGKGKDAKAKKK
ncbi:hypothetical protein HKX48_003765 [Thoreauomyces humboldtii]|nr:hypothetical protein HKX48_003765 [Thoreauomyces humboldtii]